MTMTIQCASAVEDFMEVYTDDGGAVLTLRFSEATTGDLGRDGEAAFILSPEDARRLRKALKKAASSSR